MRTLIAFVLLCGIACAADSPCAGGRCVKNTVSAAGAASKQVVKTATRPVRRIFRGR